MANVGRALAATLKDEEFAAAMERFAGAFDSYRERLPHIPYAYTRTRLFRAPHYEIVVMQWSAGSTSPIHDHGESRCWVLMLEGALEIDNFERDDPDDASEIVALRETGSLVIKAGEIDHRLTPRELHRVHNRTKDSAYSLQLYAAPIETYTVVDAHSRQSRTVTALCDLELGRD
jgi:predicted metal-dependent enzyme (double-stranded beta helix superfamily)